MLICQNLSFSQKLSDDRIKKAKKIFGERVIERILCFSLFLFGLDRTSISKALHLPPGSIRSIIRALLNGGVPAFEDRRFSTSEFLPNKKEEKIVTDLKRDTKNYIIEYGTSLKLSIPRKNTIQAKTVLLTLVNDGHINVRDVSKLLDFSTDHIRLLANKLKKEDADTFFDKRRGLQKGYVFHQETQAEIIQQYAANAAVNKKTSSETLAEDIKSRCGLDLSPRSIRFYIAKMGLSKLKQTLPELIEALKKTPKSYNCQ